MNSSNISIFDELDQAIDRVMADAHAVPDRLRSGLAELLEITPDLLHFPRPEFKTRLRLELEWQASGRAISAPAGASPENSIDVRFLSSMSGNVEGLYPVRGTNFALSVALHTALLTFVSMGVVLVGSTARVLTSSVERAVVIAPELPATDDKPHHGGGSGGSNDRMGAVKGEAPRFDRLQLTPPTVVLENHASKLVVEETLVGPPEVKLPQRDMGDPFSALVAPSSGAGISGIGTTGNGGDGPGYGRGRGPGRDGGSGGNVFAPGNGVSLPRAIYSPEPEFSDEARMAKYQGIVTLTIIVLPDGRPVDIHVSRALGMGLDEKAIAAVRTWRFEPGEKDGHPVAVRMDIEVDFHLF